MIPRLALFPLACFLAVSARAQDVIADGPVKMTPEFCFTFPVVQMNPHDISVKFPVMINPVTVLKPGMVLRVIYQPPIQSDSNDLISAHKGSMEQAYSRDNTTTSAERENALPPEMQHEIDRQRKRVWEVPGNFVLAIAQLPTDSMHLIYSPTGKDRDSDLVDTSFSFFDGMFVGSPSNDVEVLAVEKGSYADQAGVKAGDVITAVGNVPIENDLSAFASTFASVKRHAHDDEKSSFPMTVRTGGNMHTLSMPLTPTIKSFLNGDGL